MREYRSVEEMPPRHPLDPDNLRIAAGLMDLAARLARVHADPGVRTFRSWDDLVRHREARGAPSVQTASSE